MRNPLLEVNQLELMRLWAELNEAWHGINNYGGDTAEIYSYRLQPYSPMAHGPGKTEIGNIERRILCDNAANALVNLVEMFCDEYNCTATIDDIPPRKWQYEFTAFDHRAHVKIVKG